MNPSFWGLAGAVKKAAQFFDRPFYVIYSDNFSQWDLRLLKRSFEDRNATAVIAVHWREDVTQSGMIEIDDDERITRLVEKPKAAEVTSHYVSAGFFYLDPRTLQYIPENGFCDFGFHVFPEMLRSGEKIFAVRMEAPIIGIDNAEAYAKADQLAKQLDLRK